METMIAARVLDGVFDQNASSEMEVSRWGLLTSAHTVYWDDTAVDGEVVIESAPTPGYAGIWVNEGTIPFVAPSRADLVMVNGPRAVIRHRVSRIVLGGTVSSRIDGAA